MTIESFLSVTYVRGSQAGWVSEDAGRQENIFIAHHMREKPPAFGNPTTSPTLKALRSVFHTKNEIGYFPVSVGFQNIHIAALGVGGDTDSRNLYGLKKRIEAAMSSASVVPYPFALTHTTYEQHWDDIERFGFGLEGPVHAEESVRLAELACADRLMAALDLKDVVAVVDIYREHSILFPPIKSGPQLKAAIGNGAYDTSKYLLESTYYGTD